MKMHLKFGLVISTLLFSFTAQSVVESDILTVRHKCKTSNATIRAQSSITQSILDKSCREIEEIKNEFHNTFGASSRTPIPEDKNDSIEIVAFASPKDYKKYAAMFFQIDVDNGGYYLEGTPEIPGNKAQLFVMQCPDEWVGKSCQYKKQIYNLKHEIVHYLDGRYIKKGDFLQYTYAVSWAEGMAEYVANKQNHQRTLKAIKGKVIPPLYNLLFMSYEYNDLYQWGYFAMRYLSERHPAEVELLVKTLRYGDAKHFQGILANVADRTSSGFEAFVLANSEAVAPKRISLPSANTVGSCAAAQQYVRRINSAKTSMSITNYTDKPVSLFWINNNTGKPDYSKNYKTLGYGESYSAAYWKESDRLMLTDNNLNCLGTVVARPFSNHLQINADLVKSVTPEVHPSLNQLGSCDLTKPHVILDKSHTFTITNTSSYPVRLFRIDNVTGKLIQKAASNKFTYGYGTLAPGKSYTNNIWYGNRRLMITDARLNCLAVGVLDNTVSNFTVDTAMVANAATPETLPATNTISSCDLMEKHLAGPFEADFSFTNNTSTPVRVYRVDNETGQLSQTFGFKTLNQGDTYNSATSWKWFGNRRAAITDTSGNCLGIAVMSKQNTINDYQITESLLNSTTPPVISPPEPPVTPPVTPTHSPVKVGDACSSQAPNNHSILQSGSAICTEQAIRNDYYIYIKDNTSRLEINTAHGTGSVKLYAGRNWASSSEHTHSSTKAGTTVQSITVNNPSPGYYFIAVEPENSNVAIQVDVK